MGCGLQGDMVCVRAESEQCGRSVSEMHQCVVHNDSERKGIIHPNQTLLKTIISVCHLLRPQDVGLNELGVDAQHD